MGMLFHPLNANPGIIYPRIKQAKVITIHSDFLIIPVIRDRNIME